MSVCRQTLCALTQRWETEDPQYPPGSVVLKKLRSLCPEFHEVVRDEVHLPDVPIAVLNAVQELFPYPQG